MRTQVPQLGDDPDAGHIFLIGLLATNHKQNADYKHFHLPKAQIFMYYKPRLQPVRCKQTMVSYALNQTASPVWIEITNGSCCDSDADDNCAQADIHANELWPH